ncbi:Glutathione-dependent formaldehyde-activating enzyme [Rhizobium aethiopicum]|uniref:Glutathione-dependent formaldehyde-activating enzyme n=2 Tax=Rhizobium/Agrobacterium group TaxID=227290 RepID=A0A1C3Y2X5_9HYPH|nr:Glutathione-dependent formaldehyde-activating enzyme [Rhizobium aethiopicum]
MPLRITPRKDIGRSAHGEHLPLPRLSAQNRRYGRKRCDLREMTIEGDRRIFERDAAQGRKVRFHFCPNCGTSLYSEGDFNPGLCIVAVGAFADLSFPPPLISFYEGSRHDWFQLPDGMKHAQRGLVSAAAADKEQSNG